MGIERPEPQTQSITPVLHWAHLLPRSTDCHQLPQQVQHTHTYENFSKPCTYLCVAWVNYNFYCSRVMKVTKTPGPFDTMRREAVREQIQEEIQRHVNYGLHLWVAHCLFRPLLITRAGYAIHSSELRVQWPTILCCIHTSSFRPMRRLFSYQHLSQCSLK